MSDYEKIANAVLPPREDDIRVIDVTTSASTVQDTGVNDGAPRFITMISDVAFYVTFSKNGTNTVTDPDGTATSGGGRTWRVPADQPFHATIGKVERYFKARGTAAGTLRWYIS